MRARPDNPALLAASVLAAVGLGGCTDESGPSCVSGCPDGECGVGEWAPICPGRFFMGGAEGDPAANGAETRHEVTLTHGFEILSTEVTQAEFEELMGYAPSTFAEPHGEPCGLDCPVEHVTWHEAVEYCNALSAREGLRPCYECSGELEEARCELARGYGSPYECEGYRLPTEAEWEYAARAGTSTRTWAGDFDRQLEECDRDSIVEGIAWYCGNSGGTPHPVASLYPNPWGLYDVLGNVAEWAADHWCDHTSDCEPKSNDVSVEPEVDPFFAQGTESRAVRGCGWASDIELCRSQARYHGWAPGPYDNTGFRVVRTRLDIGVGTDG